MWLGDGKHLSFLLGEPRGLSLILAEMKESAPHSITKPRSHTVSIGPPSRPERSSSIT